MPELTYLGCGGTGYTRVYDGSIVLLRFFGMILCRVFSLLFFVLFPPRFVLCRTPLNGKFSRVDMIYRHVHVNHVFLKLNFDCSVTECASLKKLSYIFKKEYFKEENNKCPSWSSRLTFLLNGAFKQPREDGAARQAAHAATVDWFHVASDVEGKEVEITMGPARNQSRREMQTVLVTEINTLYFPWRVARCSSCFMIVHVIENHCCRGCWFLNIKAFCIQDDEVGMRPVAWPTRSRCLR